MHRFLRTALVGAFAFSSAVLAQTTTSCQPLNGTCPPDLALGQYVQFDFTSSDYNPNVWNSTSTPITQSNNGSTFTVRNSGDGPNMNTNFYIFFGTVSVFMKAAPGPGIVSSIVLLSDDLDEIDWEFLGTNRTMVESNFFGKGNTTTYDRAIYHTLPFAPQDDFHNYTVNWTKEKLEWIVDGKIVRTLNYGDSIALGGKNYPQTPMKVYLGAWAAGDPKNPKGIVEWAQAQTDFKQGPWSMNVKSVYIQDATSGSEYKYSDKTGNWQSIQVTEGQSTIVPILNQPFGPGAHWRSLSSGTRVAIIAGALGGFAILVIAVIFFCIRSTRKGLREHAKAEQEWVEQQREAAEWQKRYIADRASTIGSSRKSLV